MNYFKCSVGGSGKGNTVIVTCAEEFAGQTIVLAKIGKRYTKTCPSTSPYEVRFYGVEGGTYTVSATVQGQTYSETVVVQDVSCVLNYGFSWKIWVDTASQLDSTDYASLSEVLADEEAVRELFLEHACVDYMADSTNSNADLETIIDNDLCAKWINNSDYALDYLGANVVIKALMDTADKYGYGEWVVIDDTTTPPTYGPKGNVPVMTANNAPYGVASAYQVFDGNASTTASGTDFSYKFVNPICPKDFYCNVSGGTLQASNDGSTWSAPTSGSYYLYLRLHFASSVSPHTIQFYGRSLSVSVPTMTSNIAPFGEASGSSRYNTTYDYFKVFDAKGSTETYWSSASGQITNQYVRFKFPSPMVIKQVKLKNRLASSEATKNVNHFIVRGSNDGINTTSLTETLTNPSTAALESFYLIENTTPYLYYDIFAIDNHGNSSEVNINALQFYGLDYSEKEFEAGTTKKWLYDHGVELESVTLRKGSDGTSKVTQNADSIELFSGSTSSTSTTQYAVAMFNVDFSDYSLLRAKNGANYYGTSGGEPYVSIQNSDSAFPSNGTLSWTPQIGVASIVTNMLPYNISLDVSAINATNWACYGAIYHQNAKCELTELWLE